MEVLNVSNVMFLIILSIYQVQLLNVYMIVLQNKILIKMKLMLVIINAYCVIRKFLIVLNALIQLHVKHVLITPF